MTAPAAVHDPAADAVRPHGQRDRRRTATRSLYSWEQNDRGAAAGTALLNNTKTNGPLFAMFPMSGQISLDATRCSTTRRARTT